MPRNLLCGLQHGIRAMDAVPKRSLQGRLEVFGDKDHSQSHQQQRQRQVVRGGVIMEERGYIQEKLQTGEVQQEEEEQQLSTNALIELFVHMEHMQQQINKLHRFIEGNNSIALLIIVVKYYC